jgi:hypothetical protein
MPDIRVDANPFALLMDPASVISMVESSSSLERLRRRIHRPLDKPQIPLASSDPENFDLVVDAEPDLPPLIDDAPDTVQ